LKDIGTVGTSLHGGNRKRVAFNEVISQLIYYDTIITKLNYLITYRLAKKCSLAYRCFSKFGSDFRNAQILCCSPKSDDSIFNQNNSIL